MAHTIFKLLTAAGLLFSINGFAARTCPRPAADEKGINKADYPLAESMEAIKTAAERDYADGSRRLSSRAYLDGEVYRLPSRSGMVLPQAVIAAITSHIEQALAASYVDYVIFPDMGHVHVYAPLPITESSQDIQRADLSFVYHTAEMIRLREGDWFKGELVKDPWLRWRYYSRNLLGELDPTRGLKILFEKKEHYNTIRQLPGQKEITTIYFSANKDGCFSYQAPDGEKHFDIGDY